MSLAYVWRERNGLLNPSSSFGQGHRWREGIVIATQCTPIGLPFGLKIPPRYRMSCVSKCNGIHYHQIFFYAILNPQFLLKAWTYEHSIDRAFYQPFWRWSQITANFFDKLKNRGGWGQLTKHKEGLEIEEAGTDGRRKSGLRRETEAIV